MAGKTAEGVPLSPVAHMTANAQIEIEINLNGKFCGVHPVEKEKSKTIIPVTEASASRSSGDAPHPLCDNLTYVAGDFGQYLSDKKSADKAEERFQKYISALQSWAESPYSHPKVRAVYAYVAKKEMTADLIRAKILEASDGKLCDKKVSGAVYEKALVRFRVIDDQPYAVWQDESLFDRYARYYGSQQGGGGGTSAISPDSPIPWRRTIRRALSLPITAQS